MRGNGLPLGCLLSGLGVCIEIPERTLQEAARVLGVLAQGLGRGV